MISRTGRSLPALVVALALSLPAVASEGQVEQAIQPVPPAPATAASAGGALLLSDLLPAVRRAAPVAPPPVASPPAAATAARPPVVAAAGVPAPRPLPRNAGPVWTDASGAWRQAGIASWYGGKRWQGRLTASGVRYDENHLTAAHASLPMGAQVRVTVVDTGRSVIVTINDRPGTRKRIIDLSRAAAEELGILRRGVAQVHISPG